MKKIKTGDLVYIPSEVTLYQKKNKNAVSAHVKVKKPINVLVTEVKTSSFEIYYQNEYWLVDKNNTYQVKEEL